MLLAVGISYACIYLIAYRGHENRFLQYILCAVVITTIEFVTGTIVNKILGWGVWDYSNRRWNLCGQICARYCLYWLLLSVPCCGLARLIYRYIFHGSG